MPDHPTCATCKHWLKRGFSYGMCDKIGRWEYVYGVDDGDQWLVADDRPSSPILTGPSFGCIHHESNEREGDER